MRIVIQLNPNESSERREALAANPKANTDFKERVLGETLWKHTSARFAEGVDLVDADGTYLYTIVGDPRPLPLNAVVGDIRLKPVNREAAAQLAYQLLLRARDLFKQAGATRALDRIRGVIPSAQGAVRAASRREMRAYHDARRAEEEMDIERVAVVRE